MSWAQFALLVFFLGYISFHLASFRNIRTSASVETASTSTSSAPVASPPSESLALASSSSSSSSSSSPSASTKSRPLSTSSVTPTPPSISFLQSLLPPASPTSFTVSLFDYLLHLSVLVSTVWAVWTHTLPAIPWSVIWSPLLASVNITSAGHTRLTDRSDSSRDGVGRACTEDHQNPALVCVEDRTATPPARSHADPSRLPSALVNLLTLDSVSMFITLIAAFWLLYRAWKTLCVPVPALIETLRVEIPDPPDVSLAGIRSDAATLQWTRPATNNKSIQKFIIQINGINVGDSPSQESAITVTGLKPGHFYNVRVIAVGVNNFQVASPIIRLQTYGEDGQPRLGNARVPLSFPDSVHRKAYSISHTASGPPTTAMVTAASDTPSDTDRTIGLPSQDHASSQDPLPPTPPKPPSRRNTGHRRNPNSTPTLPSTLPGSTAPGSSSTTSTNGTPHSQSNAGKESPRSTSNPSSRPTTPTNDALTALNTKFEKIRHEIDETMQQITHEESVLHQQEDELRDTLQTKRQAIKDKENAIEALKKSVKSTREQMRSAEKEKQRRETLLSSSTTKKQTISSKIEQLCTETKDMKDQCDEWQRNHTTLIEERDRQIANLTAETEQLAQECAALEAQLRTKGQELQEVKEKRDSLTASNVSILSGLPVVSASHSSGQQTAASSTSTVTSTSTAASTAGTTFHPSSTSAPPPNDELALLRKDYDMRRQEVEQKISAESRKTAQLESYRNALGNYTAHFHAPPTSTTQTSTTHTSTAPNVPSTAPNTMALSRTGTDITLGIERNHGPNSSHNDLVNPNHATNFTYGPTNSITEGSSTVANTANGFRMFSSPQFLKIPQPASVDHDSDSGPHDLGVGVSPTATALLPAGILGDFTDESDAAEDDEETVVLPANTREVDVDPHATIELTTESVDADSHTAFPQVDSRTRSQDTTSSITASPPLYGRAAAEGMVGFPPSLSPMPATETPSPTYPTPSRASTVGLSPLHRPVRNTSDPSSPARRFMAASVGSSWFGRQGSGSGSGSEFSHGVLGGSDEGGLRPESFLSHAGMDISPPSSRQQILGFAPQPAQPPSRRSSPFLTGGSLTHHASTPSLVERSSSPRLPTGSGSMDVTRSLTDPSYSIWNHPDVLPTHSLSSSSSSLIGGGAPLGNAGGTPLGHGASTMLGNGGTLANGGTLGGASSLLGTSTPLGATSGRYRPVSIWTALDASRQQIWHSPPSTSSHTPLPLPPPPVLRRSSQGSGFVGSGGGSSSNGSSGLGGSTGSGVGGTSIGIPSGLASLSLASDDDEILDSRNIQNAHVGVIGSRLPSSHTGTLGAGTGATGTLANFGPSLSTNAPGNALSINALSSNALSANHLPGNALPGHALSTGTLSTNALPSHTLPHTLSNALLSAPSNALPASSMSGSSMSGSSVSANSLSANSLSANSLSVNSLSASSLSHLLPSLNPQAALFTTHKADDVCARGHDQGMMSDKEAAATTVSTTPDGEDAKKSRAGSRRAAPARRRRTKDTYPVHGGGVGGGVGGTVDGSGDSNGSNGRGRGYSNSNSNSNSHTEMEVSVARDGPKVKGNGKSGRRRERDRPDMSRA